MTLHPHLGDSTKDHSHTLDKLDSDKVCHDGNVAVPEVSRLHLEDEPDALWLLCWPNMHRLCLG